MAVADDVARSIQRPQRLFQGPAEELAVLFVGVFEERADVAAGALADAEPAGCAGEPRLAQGAQHGLADGQRQRAPGPRRFRPAERREAAPARAARL